jgi:hypothetical protein
MQEGILNDMDMAMVGYSEINSCGYTNHYRVVKNQNSMKQVSITWV